MSHTSLLYMTPRKIKNSAGPSSSRAQTQAFRRYQNFKYIPGVKFMSN